MRHINAIGMSWDREWLISTVLYAEVYRVGKFSMVTEDREISLGIPPELWRPTDVCDNGTLTEYLDAVVRRMPPILVWHECVETIPAGGYL